MVFIWCAFAALAAEHALAGSGIELVSPAMDWEKGRLTISAGVDFRPGAEPREALDNGVPLVIAVEARISRVYWLIAREQYRESRLLEIRYMPLSRHYQLTDLSTRRQQTFPRLSMLLESLQRPVVLAMEADRAYLAGRRWQIQTRTVLKLSRLPSPMRLPAWFSGEWRLRSRWHTWHFDED